ncbi:MAG: Uma2 family endonuclease [Candidatus Rokubacteria bacterium]|nr:Uma2 family endonuclease [Candidatus Rokubacteria bacterium]
MEERRPTDVASSASSPLAMTEWANLPEDESGEWVDGLLVEEEVTDYLHEVVVVWFAAQFRAWLADQGGFVGGSDAKFAVSPRRGRKPDLSVFLPEGRVPPARGLIRVPPDIIVEVVSIGPRDGRRDRVEKLNEYAAFGVRFYWIVDPEERSLQVFELSPDGRYVHALGVTGGMVDSVPGCPGLRLDLDALWRETDRLGPPTAEDDA